MKKRLRDSTYFCWGLTAFLVITAGSAVFLLLSQWSRAWSAVSRVLAVFSPVLIGLILAYILGKVASALERRFFLRAGELLYPTKPDSARRAARVLAIVSTSVLALVFVCGLLALIIPQILSSVESLVTRMPGYLNTAVEWLNKYLSGKPELEQAAVNTVGNLSEELTKWIQATVISQSEQIIANITSGVFSVVRALANIVIGFIFSVYLMYQKERFAAQCKKLLYGIFSTGRANRLLGGLHFIDKTCGGFLTGKLLDSLIVAVVCYVFMLLFGLPYPAFISVLIGVTNLIPFFGPFIGGVPAALIILLEAPSRFWIFLIFLLVLQQLDGNILFPRITGGSTGMSGFWVIFAVMVAGGFFGFWGFVFGVPVFSVLYAFIRAKSARRLRNRALPPDTKEFEKIAYFDAGTGVPVFKADLPPEPPRVRNGLIYRLIRRKK